jgi:hypothetical protein
MGDPLPVAATPTAHRRLDPYVPRVLLRHLAETPDAVLQTVDATVVFADISGFTKLSERLARLGREGPRCSGAWRRATGTTPTLRLLEDALTCFRALRVEGDAAFVEALLAEAWVFGGHAELESWSCPRRRSAPEPAARASWTQPSPRRSSALSNARNARSSSAESSPTRPWRTATRSCPRSSIVRNRRAARSASRTLGEYA